MQPSSSFLTIDRPLRLRARHPPRQSKRRRPQKARPWVGALRPPIPVRNSHPRPPAHAQTRRPPKPIVTLTTYPIARTTVLRRPPTPPADAPKALPIHCPSARCPRPTGCRPTGRPKARCPPPAGCRATGYPKARRPPAAGCRRTGCRPVRCPPATGCPAAWRRPATGCPAVRCRQRTYRNARPRGDAGARSRARRAGLLGLRGRAGVARRGCRGR